MYFLPITDGTGYLEIGTASTSPERKWNTIRIWSTAHSYLRSGDTYLDVSPSGFSFIFAPFVPTTYLTLTESAFTLSFVDLLPGGTTGTLDLGSTSARWGGVYCVTLNATNTTFNGKAYTWPSSAAAAGTVLTNDGSGGLSWTAVSGGASTLAGLTDVTIASVADNEVLAWDTATSKWINQTAAEAGLSAVGHTHSYLPLTGGSISGQLTSTLATGTAPISVTSTTLCPHLNADLLDGNEASAFAVSSHGHSGASWTSLTITTFTVSSTITLGGKTYTWSGTQGTTGAGADE